MRPGVGFHPIISKSRKPTINKSNQAQITKICINLHAVKATIKVEHELDKKIKSFPKI